MLHTLRRTTALLAVLLGATALVFAGGSGEDEAAPAPAQGDTAQQATPTEQVLRIGIAQEPANLNSILMTGIYAEALAGNLYDTLVSLKEDSANPQPLLAESWDISDDGLTYTFNLRDDVLFHNGEAFSAEDVKFTFDQILDEANASPSAEFFQQIDEVVVVDEYTVRFDLSSPYAALILALGNPTAGIIPKDTVEETGMDAFDRNPVGTGPYQFVEWVPDDRVVLEKNADYFITEPALDRVVFRPIPQPETMAAELLAGGIHIAPNIMPQDIDRIDGRDNLRIEVEPGLSNRYLGFSDAEMPFADPRFRKAVYHMVDFDAMVEGIWGDSAQRAYSWIPPNTLGGETAELERAALSYNPDQAQQLIDELRADGVLEEGFSFTIYSVQDPARSRVAQAVATALRDYNIDAAVETPEWGTLLPMLEEGVPMYAMGWGSVPDPDRWTYRIFHSTSNRNFSRVDDPEIDALLEEGRRVTDNDKRRQIYHDVMMKLVAEEYVHIPLVWLNTIVGVNESVQDFKASPQNYFHLVTEERNVSLQ
ncbi:MAG: ABC transporter substrate-binding protein [Spirochaeta sp.]|jgi:peptide/nickel transport system substrate-binding protein|nr:ABC transporter substrate-binding protein [Spirochaeta sp.]